MAETKQEFRFKQKQLYSATILKQDLNYGKDDVPQLTFAVLVDGEVVNSRKPAQGCLAVPKCEVDVQMQFPAEDEQRLKIAMKDLTQLGFVDATGNAIDDLERLHPGHKNHKSFVGSKVFVTPTIKTYNDKEVTFFNFRFPSNYENKAVGKGEIGKSAANAAWRDLLKKKNEEALEAKDTPSF
jgi:hypothetical protein